MPTIDTRNIGVYKKEECLQLSIALFLFSFVLLSVWHGLLVSNAYPRVEYRFESSFVVVLQRLGVAFLLSAIYLQLQLGRLPNILFWLALAAYVTLNIPYSILDFILSF